MQNDFGKAMANIEKFFLDNPNGWNQLTKKNFGKEENMENRLLELKEQFCKWYCPHKDEIINPNENCDKEIKCNDCGELTPCEQTNNPIDLCDECQIEDFIIFIRDELN